MKNLFLRNKNDNNIILKCDAEFRPIAEMPIGQLRPRDKAFYVDVPDGYIGVFSSKNGPVLFINSDKYLFVDFFWKIAVKEGLVNNEVWFSNLLTHDLHFEYKRVELDPYRYTQLGAARPRAEISVYIQALTKGLVN